MNDATIFGPARNERLRLDARRNRDRLLHGGNVVWGDARVLGTQADVPETTTTTTGY